MVSRPRGEKSERRIERIFLGGEKARGFKAIDTSLSLHFPFLYAGRPILLALDLQAQGVG